MPVRDRLMLLQVLQAVLFNLCERFALFLLFLDAFLILIIHIGLLRINMRYILLLQDGYRQVQEVFLRLLLCRALELLPGLPLVQFVAPSGRPIRLLVPVEALHREGVEGQLLLGQQLFGLDGVVLAVLVEDS